METPTFHSFPRLPKELRLDIWKLALPDPRIIEFSLKTRNIHALTKGPDWVAPAPWMQVNWHWAADGEKLNTSLARTSAEAREVFNEAYDTVKAIDRGDGNPMSTTARIDYRRDVIYLSNVAYTRLDSYQRSGFGGSWPTEWTAGAENVALNWAIVRDRGRL
jgi:hypothetical protein